MVSHIEFLEGVCERMQQARLVKSKAEFSTRMLGKGPSYLTSMSARSRQVPDDVMSFLTDQLMGDIEADDAAIVILAGQLSQHQRDYLQRSDLLDWIGRHQTLPTQHMVDERAKQQGNVTVLSIAKRLTSWLSFRRTVMS